MVVVSTISLSPKTSFYSTSNTYFALLLRNHQFLLQFYDKVSKRGVKYAGKLSN